VAFPLWDSVISVVGFKPLTTEDTEFHRDIRDKQKARWPHLASAGLDSVLVNSASHPRRRAVRVVMMVVMASRQHESITLREEPRHVNQVAPRKTELVGFNFPITSL